MAIPDERSREQVILDALVHELRRQDINDVAALDLQHIAIAIDAALGDPPDADAVPPEIDGLEPTELNAANDS